MIDNSNTKYISLKQASKLCKYSQEYLSLRARHGKIKAVKIGRNWVTKKEWINEYVNKIKKNKGDMGDRGNKGNWGEKGREEIEEKGKSENIGRIIPQCDFLLIAQKVFVLILVFAIIGAGIVFAKPSIDFASAAMSDVAESAIKTIEQFSDNFCESVKTAENNFNEFNYGIINAIDKYNNSISDTIIDTSEFVSQSFISTQKGIQATEQNFNSSAQNVKMNFVSGYNGVIILASKTPEIISNDIFQRIGTAKNKIENATTNVSLFLADATESVEYSFDVFGKYGKWVVNKADDVSKSISHGLNSVSNSATNTYNGIANSVNNTREFIFSPWAENKIKQEIVIQDIQDIKSAEELEELKKEIVSIQEKIATMERDGLPQKEIIKEVQRITKIEPLKEITKEIQIIDNKSLLDFKTQLASFNSQLATINKWETDIENLQSITKKLQLSPPNATTANAPIYIASQGIQSGGSASFASLGVSGSAGFGDLGVGGSASFGTNSGDFFNVHGTSTFNSAVTMLNGLTVGSSALIIDADGNITTNQDITTTGTGNLVIAGDLTVGGTQTYSGSSSFTSSSDTASGLSVNQQGIGNIVQFQDNGNNAFVISDGGQVALTSTSSPQMSIKYDDTNKFDIAVSSTGVTTFDASSGEIHAAEGDMFYTEGGNPIRESGEEILRGSVSIFLYGMPVQTHADDFIKISKYFSDSSDISFPTAFTGTTRVHRLVINYADDIAIDANSNWRVASADSSTIYSEFNLSGLANTILEEPMPYITEAITIPDTDWQIELKTPTDKNIRIFQIYLTAYDKVN